MADSADWEDFRQQRSATEIQGGQLLSFPPTTAVKYLRCAFESWIILREDASDLFLDILYEDTASEVCTTAENAPFLTAVS